MSGLAMRDPPAASSEVSAGAHASHPLAGYGLDMLVRGAARLRGERPALSEAGAGASAETLTYRDLDLLATAFAARATECGLRPGERVVIVGAARTGVLTALFGALAAGLEPVIAPSHLSVGALAFLAQSTGAAAMMGPTRYGAFDGEQKLLEAAASAPEVRVVGSLGPDRCDDAIDFSPDSFDRAAALAPRPPRRDEPPCIGLVLPADQKAPRATFLPQRAIVAQALDVVSHMHIAAGRPIVSLLSPASVVGLIAGPVAALLAGTNLVLFGPFGAASFIDLLSHAGQPHVLAPEAIGRDLADAGLDDGRALAGLGLARSAGAAAIARPTGACPTTLLTADDSGAIVISDS